MKHEINMNYLKNVTISSENFSSLIFKLLSVVNQSSRGNLYTLSSVTSSVPVIKIKQVFWCPHYKGLKTLSKSCKKLYIFYNKKPLQWPLCHLLQMCLSLQRWNTFLILSFTFHFFKETNIIYIIINNKGTIAPMMKIAYLY